MKIEDLKEVNILTQLKELGVEVNKHIEVDNNTASITEKKEYPKVIGLPEIAEKLSVSIDKIPEVYEGLKWQYVVWEACDSISWIFGIAALFATPFFIVLTFNWITTDWEWQNESTRLKYKKFLKISTWILISCISSIVFSQILKFVFAPDIIFLKGVLGGC